MTELIDQKSETNQITSTQGQDIRSVMFNPQDLTPRKIGIQVLTECR